MNEDQNQVSDIPDIDHLQQELVRAGGTYAGSFTDRTDNVRLAKWSGQTYDGKKHRSELGEDPFPWEGASDNRILFADGIINDLGQMLSLAVTKAELKIAPGIASDYARAATAEKVMKQYVDRMRTEMDAEVELMWQWGLSRGAAIWQITWDREVSMRLVEFTMEQVDEMAAQFAQQAPDSVLAKLGWIVRDPEQEDMAITVVQGYAASIVQALVQRLESSGDYASDKLSEFKLSTANARKAIRALRDEGKAQIALPYIKKNGPRVIARKIGEDIFVPPETTDLQTARWIQVVEWLSEVEIDSAVLTDGWDPDWAEAAKKSKGTAMLWPANPNADTMVNSQGTLSPVGTASGQSELVEVVTAYRYCITEEGVPQIWCTVYCPHATKSPSGDPLAAKHYAQGYEHGKYPFVDFRRERLGRRLYQSRGIAEISSTWQNEYKRQSDMLSDRTAIEINPGVTVPNRLGMKYKYGPGVQNSVLRPGEIQHNEAPTGNPSLAFQLMAEVKLRAADYFGLMHPEVLPSKWQMKMEKLANDFLNSVEDVYTQVFELVQQMADDEELSRIAGDQVNFPKSPDEIVGAFSWTLHFDTRNLDLDYVQKKLQAITTMAIPLDVAGVIDRSKLVNFILMAIDPQLARMIVSDQTSASQAMFRSVNEDLAHAYLGNEPEYVENDPTAQRKLGYMQQIVQANPKYQSALGMAPGAQPDPLFIGIVKKMEANLNMSVQQEQNKQVGRIGVKPGAQA